MAYLPLPTEAPGIRALLTVYCVSSHAAAARKLSDGEVPSVDQVIALGPDSFPTRSFAPC